MARELDIPLFEIVRSGTRLVRYLKCSGETLRVLLSERPLVVCVPNPSVVLNVMLLALRWILDFRLISDAHYGGIVAVNGSRWLQWTLEVINRRADLVIVTNEAHAETVNDLGGHSFICPDPLPVPPTFGHPSKAAERPEVMFICSFATDEPYEDVLDAGPLLDGLGLQMIVSGDYEKVGINPEEHPSVRFLGYVDIESYWENLWNAAVVLDFTNHDACLVCGGYEAMVAEKPLVLSATPALRGFFTHGTVFCGHEATEIAAATAEAYRKRRQLEGEAGEWKRLHRAHIHERISTLKKIIADYAGDPHSAESLRAD